MRFGKGNVRKKLKIKMYTFEKTCHIGFAVQSLEPEKRKILLERENNKEKSVIKVISFFISTE